MTGKGKITAALLAAALLTMVAAGCGGGSSSSADTTAAKETNSKETAPKETNSKEAPSNGSQPEPSAEFADNSPLGKLAKYGREASPAEREAASHVIEKSLKAREAGDWETQCSTLTKRLVEQLEESATLVGAEPGCAKALEAQAIPVPKSALANTMSGPIDALRVKEDTAYAFYHGTEGKDYILPLLEQGGEWKLASIKEEELR